MYTAAVKVVVVLGRAQWASLKLSAKRSFLLSCISLILFPHPPVKQEDLVFFSWVTNCSLVKEVHTSEQPLGTGCPLGEIEVYVQTLRMPDGETLSCRMC